jgi:UDP-N-acetylmuramoyl-tripeptide--D-alanyl-D-alanine ligase
MPAFAADKMATWTGGGWTRLPRGAVSGFTQDTRQLTSGQAFVALKTEKQDGADFLAAAEAQGASAGIVARAVPASALPQLVVPEVLAAFQRIAREHRREFSGSLIGITGSAGKTSTKDLLGVLLGGPPRVLTTAGNLNNQIGVPLTLTRLDSAQHDFAVIEAGISAPGDMAPLAEMIEPDHSIVTLVAPAHLEKLGTVEQVAREKALLPAANREGGLAVFPASCWQYPQFQALTNARVLVPEGEQLPALAGTGLGYSVSQLAGRTRITLGAKRIFTLRRVSPGMAQNTALALALASELGVGDAVLQARLTGWQPTPWRGEVRTVGDAVIYCDFYNANPASMADAIEAFNGTVPPERPRLYVLGCMEELGDDSVAYHRLLGRQLQLRRGDFLYVLGSQAAALRDGLLEGGNAADQVEIVTDLAAVREQLATYKGAVFLKGSRRYQLETVLNPMTAEAAH